MSLVGFWFVQSANLQSVQSQTDRMHSDLYSQVGHGNLLERVAKVSGKTFLVSNSSELSSAKSSAKPGDAIVFKNGTYSNFSFTIDISGDATHPIYILAEDNQGVTFTGSSYININGDYVHFEGFVLKEIPSHAITIRGDHVRVTHCMSDHVGSNVGHFVIYLKGSSEFAEIDNNLFYDTHSIDIAFYQSHEPGKDQNCHRPHVHHNTFKDHKKRFSNGGECIMAGWGSETSHDNNDIEAIIEYNHFLRCQGDQEVISLKSSRNIVRYNYFEDCGDSHISMRSGDYNQIIGNVMVGNEVTCIRLNGRGNYVANNYFNLNSSDGYQILTFHGMTTMWPTEDNTVIFNTFSGGKDILYVRTRSTVTIPLKGNVIANNIFLLDTPGKLFNDQTGALSQEEMFNRNTFENNIIWSKSNSSALNSWNTGSSQVADPLLVLENNIPTLSAASPAIDKGKAIFGGKPEHDITLYIRDSLPDIGAYEFASASTLLGDVNGDGVVDELDIQACVDHILEVQDWGEAADVNGDGRVNVLDVQRIVGILSQ
jgi:poly(beta-D-mannuronate) lyase